jgi:hypothetical protein
MNVAMDLAWEDLIERPGRMPMQPPQSVSGATITAIAFLGKRLVNPFKIWGLDEVDLRISPLMFDQIGFRNACTFTVLLGPGDKINIW